MRRILEFVLRGDPEVAEAIDAHVDDIVVDAAEVWAERGVQVLNSFGLKAKGPLPGLRVVKTNDRFQWKRDRPMPKKEQNGTRRKIFACAAHLLGDLPVGAWLRPASSMLQRFTSTAD